MNNTGLNGAIKPKFPFGKVLLASGVGTLIVLVVVSLFKFGLFAIIVGAIASQGSKENVAVVKNESFLKIDLTELLPERSPSKLNSLLSQGTEVGFTDLGKAIENAANDKKINGIYLYMGSSYPYSWGMSSELRDMLAAFKEKSGKPILAYGTAYSQKGYFLASIADSIYVHPSGLVEFVGIGAEVMYYKELIDRLGIKITLLRPRSNSYKSAGETYTTSKMSDANREQIRTYIGSIWSYAVEQMSESRSFTEKQLNDMADNLSAYMPNDALNSGLVDRLCFENSVKRVMKETYSMKQTVDLKDYITTIPTQRSADRIAVIYAQGNVVDGTGVSQAVYSERITQALDDAAKDDRIKAIVLRVNSPGGAVTASEMMTDAVVRAKKSKPVVVSMSDVAASAGYEISCNANVIVAQPTTLTGSIGVFGILPEVGNTVRRYLGITTDTVNTNRNSTSMSLLHGISPEVIDMMQENIEDFYKIFVGRVANGRHLKYEYVDSIARGRVWTGRDALRLGLVDTLGGLTTAIQIAADLAEVSQYQVIDYPTHKSFFEELKEFSKETPSMSAQNRTYVPNTEPQKYQEILATQLFSQQRRGYTDGVWMPTRLIEHLVDQLCETKGVQARVEFILLSE